MIVTFLMDILLRIFGGIEVYILPRLPSIFQSLWSGSLNLLADGLMFIQVTFDMNTIRGFLAWWLSVRAIVFIAEVIYHIWVVVTGNDNSGAPTVSN